MDRTVCEFLFSTFRKPLKSFQRLGLHCVYGGESSCCPSSNNTSVILKYFNSPRQTIAGLISPSENKNLYASHERALPSAQSPARGSCAAAGLTCWVETSGWSDSVRSLAAEALCRLLRCAASRRRWWKDVLAGSSHQSLEQKGLACTKLNTSPFLGCCGSAHSRRLSGVIEVRVLKR